MPSLHVEPDMLHLISRTFWQANYQMANHVDSVRTSAYRLELAWQGGDAEEYLQELHTVVEHLQALADNMISFGLTLSREGDLWDESDQRWAIVFRDVFSANSGD